MIFTASFAIIISLIASISAEILCTTLIGFTPEWVPLARILLLVVATGLSRLLRGLRSVSTYATILTAVSVIQIGTSSLAGTEFWTSHFSPTTFAGSIGGSILLKVIATAPLLGLLLLLLPSRSEFYLVTGDLSVRARPIRWLGIEGDRIRWGKLALISGALISTGTVLLTMVTVTGFSSGNGIGRLIQYSPLILVLAAVNSVCEGILFRNSVLGTLRRALPGQFVILLAAAFFGIAHYYGAPGGPVGVVMAGALGWYMCRSMVETGGFVSSWIIHFMQDVVIFSTMLVTG